jgi:DNA-binding transcriptional LysR family regulator
VDIQLLRSFIVTAEMGNVTAAAKRLHLSQPTLSRQIKTLEDHLGIKLFERVGKFIRLSNSGESLLEQCRTIVELVQNLPASVHALRSGHAGLLKVGASPQLLERLFPLFLPSFQTENPGVEIRITEAHSTSLLEMLSAGDLHVAMSPFSSDPRYRMHKLGHLKVLAAGRPETGRSRRTTIDIGEVCEHKILALKRGFKSRDLFDAACRLKGLRPVIALESTAPHTLIALAGAGIGYAIIPSQTPISSSTVRALQLTIGDKPIEFDYAAAWDPSRPMPLYAHSFIRSAQIFVRQKQ